MLWKKTDKKFSLQDIYTGHHQVTYRGVPAIKCPFDYVLYQMIVTKIKPDIVVEIGTNKGGSTLYLADLLNLNNKGIIHSIDLPGNHEDPALQHHPRIQLFRNGYQSYDASVLTQFNTVMVIEDGSHTYEDALAALKKFSPYVTPGSYYIVEDGIVTDLGMEKEFNGGPQKAIREFLEQNRQFRTDRSYCDFFGKNATFNTDGYLKKIS